MEQITYLPLIRGLDNAHTLEESRALLLNQPLPNPVFPAGRDLKGWRYDDLRRERFKHFAPAALFEMVGKQVFSFIKGLFVVEA